MVVRDWSTDSDMSRHRKVCIVPSSSHRQWSNFSLEYSRQTHQFSFSILYELIYELKY